jgi:hypothetical protein
MKFRLLQIFLLAVSFQSLAESAFDYDYLYGGLGYTKVDSPLSKDEINTRLSSFGISLEPGAQFILQTGFAFQTIKDNSIDPTNGSKIELTSDYRSFYAGVARYFVVSDILNISFWINTWQIYRNSELDSSAQYGSRLLLLQDTEMSSRTSASVSVEVKPSVNSPVEFRSEIYHDIESNDDSLSVSLEAGAKISKSLLGRVTYSKSIEAPHPSYTFGLRYFY